MPQIMDSAPYSAAETVTEILHGIPVDDPYRWLEDPQSTRTREWILSQNRYARSCLESIPYRERIRERIRQLLDVETYDSVQKIGTRYFFRKRVVGQEQPCLCFREGTQGADQLLIDPAQRGTGPYTAVRLRRVSPDGRLLLYEVKQGGERMGIFELFDIEKRQTLADGLSRGYLRGFAFAPDGQSFYYVHEADDKKSRQHAAYCHVLGTNPQEDREVFCAGDNDQLRLHIIAGAEQLGFLVIRFGESVETDFYLCSLLQPTGEPKPVIRNAHYKFGPLLLKDGRVLAITDLNAPNSRIVEVRQRPCFGPEFLDIVPSTDILIQNWTVSGDRIFVGYLRNLKSEIRTFDLYGKPCGQVPVNIGDTARLIAGSQDADELLLEQESFTKPPQICRYLTDKREVTPWIQKLVPFDSSDCGNTQVWFTAKDGTRIPMFLVGRREVLESGTHPAIMTAYGGYGVPMTPKFSVLVAVLLERGCLFALPNIRGGSEFGHEWHEAARRRKRQVAFDDFLAAAEWLIEAGRTEPRKLAVFGGSNSGLLVGAAITQRPELFRAALCMVPMLDMLRYHLFDDAQVWKEELGTAAEAEDFGALLAYSPYHNVRDNTVYPATMLVSGDADQNCNPMHARKMTARLQAANASTHPILLDYSPQRGHSPVLPLRERVAALADRTAFLCQQLQLEW